MLTNSSRARSSSAARCHSRLVWTSTPITRVDHEHRGLAHAQRAERVGDEARVARGVDQVDLALLPLERATARRRSTSGATSRRDRSRRPWCRRPPIPSRLIAPASNSSASCSDVLPLPRWPTSATLRMRSAGLCMPCLLSSSDPESRRYRASLRSASMGPVRAGPDPDRGPATDRPAWPGPPAPPSADPLLRVRPPEAAGPWGRRSKRFPARPGRGSARPARGCARRSGTARGSARGSPGCTRPGAARTAGPARPARTSPPRRSG